MYKPEEFSAEIYFGDLILFLNLEALVFVAQICSMPLCVMRMKFRKIIEFSEDTYCRVLNHINEANNLKSSKEKVKVSMMNNKYELDVWPSGLTVNDEVMTFNKDNTKIPSM
jgi:hypothetical protein